MKVFRTIFCLAFVFALTFSISLYPANSEEIPLNQYGIRSTNPYVVDQFVENGKTIDKIIVPGPPSPPVGFFRPSVTTLPIPNPAAGINVLTNVPASTWAFGCSATSAAMMFGYHDNSGFTNMYAGPTNGGAYPMTNATWGTVVINGETRALNPLSATRNGLDGRAIKGHVDDYWIKYGNAASDPFITGGWTEHTKGDCTGDYMGTNQSSFANTDGSTMFYNYGDGSPLYDYTGVEPGNRDGCHGMKLFVESRGYAVQSSGNFNQYIYGYNGNTLGFTFANFKAEIDAGRPVLIQVQGHTMLGFGYDDSGTTIYIHDTWDYLNHSMTWGGSYSGMIHYGVSVCRLASFFNSQVLSSCDFNGDGRSDIAVWRPSDGYWYIMDQGAYQWGANGDVPVPGDYNGDGQTDVAVWRPSDGYWYVMGQGAYQWGANGDIPVSADYNADGKDEPAVFRPGNGYWYIYYQGTGAYNAWKWGQAGDIPVVADYDHDGYADLAVYRPQEGMWYIRKSADWGTMSCKWGTGADIPVPGDYDQDGYADVAVFRPADGTWYIRKSSDWVMLSYKWGTGNDIPITNDYDGDGKTDITVWRPGNGYWYIKDQGAYQWGVSSDIPLD